MRALEALFAEAAAKAPDIEYEFSVSVLEIYNEKASPSFLLPNPTPSFD